MSAHLAIRSRSASRAAYATAGAALLALAAAAASEHGAWALASVGLLGPDLALLLGAGRGLAHGQLHPRAVGAYNALHRFWAPLALVIAAGLDVLGPGWLALGLAWAAHVAVDRAVGYGLRDAQGFQRGA